MQTENKKILIVDMDEVLYQCWASVLYAKFTGTQFKSENRKTLLIQALFNTKKELDAFVDFSFSQENYYYGIPLIEGAQEVMRKLNEKYSLYICTDYLFKGYEWTSEKAILFKTEVLKRDFPFINPEQYIFMRGKHLLHADILIDDRASNFGPHINQGLLFTAIHNKGMTDKELKDKNLIRVNSWKQIGEILL